MLSTYYPEEKKIEILSKEVQELIFILAKATSTAKNNELHKT